MTHHKLKYLALFLYIIYSALLRICKQHHFHVNYHITQPCKNIPEVSLITLLHLILDLLHVRMLILMKFCISAYFMRTNR